MLYSRNQSQDRTRDRNRDRSRDPERFVTENVRIQTAVSRCEQTTVNVIRRDQATGTGDQDGTATATAVNVL